MSITKSKGRKLAEFLRNITTEAKLTTEAVQDDKVVTTGADLDSKSTDTTALVSAASVTSYVGDKLGDYVHGTHDINLTFTGDVTGHGTITDMSHTTFNLTLDAETLPVQAGYAGKFLTTDGTAASWATVDTSAGDTAFSWGNHTTAGYFVNSGSWQGTHTDKTRVYGISSGGGEVWFGYAGGKGNVIADGEFYANEGQYVLWNAGNDGSGSGLDADLLDGNHASAFALSHGHPYLSNATDSEQTAHFGLVYWNQSAARVNSDPRINEPGYDGDNVNIHWWTTTAAGANYGRVGHALYNGSAYQYLHTKASQDHIYHNNNKIWTSGNDGSGSGLDADLLDGQHASAFASASHSHTPESIGAAKFVNNAYLNSSTTTATFITELTNEFGCFNNSQVTLKCAWSYAGNSNLDTGHPTIGTIELAGCTIETWGGTYKHVRITRPNTGAGGHGVYEYNDQSSSYAPGWREIWTSESDGSGSGLDADLLDGQQGSYYAPASHSHSYLSLTGGTLTGDLQFNSGANVHRGTHSSGYLVGSYNSVGANSAKSNPIYTIGSSYQPNDTSLSNMYGIGYAHPNFWGSGKSNGWGMYVCEAGAIKATISGDGIWTVGTVRAASYVYNSDAAFKENIEPLENSLDTILKLEGVKYTLKESGKSSIGFIAQDVEKVIPEFVEGDEGHKGVNYGQMVAVLTEAMKEQQKQIQELRAEIEELKNESK